MSDIHTTCRCCGVPLTVPEEDALDLCLACFRGKGGDSDEPCKAHPRIARLEAKNAELKQRVQNLAEMGILAGRERGEFQDQLATARERERALAQLRFDDSGNLFLLFEGEWISWRTSWSIYADDHAGKTRRFRAAKQAVMERVNEAALAAVGEEAEEVILTPAPKVKRGVGRAGSIITRPPAVVEETPDA